jgi:hypothetical protein
MGSDATPPFEEHRLLSTPIRDLGLTIEGTPLEPLLEKFRGELLRVGIRRLRPQFYLSTEWGVPFGTISIAMPFYLARPDLKEVQAKRAAHVEGRSRADLLRYLRHEMGHVVNYAYRLYERPEWIALFGSMTQPYVEDYRPEPFSPRFVNHLPGWYAQKHPDEDWAETFAVWMTPRHDWRKRYAEWPEALRKLDWCDRTMREANESEPLLTATERDEDVSDVADSLEEHYGGAGGEAPLPPGIDGALQAVFEEFGEFGEPDEAGGDGPRRGAADLIRSMELDLVSNVYRWTGHPPEPTRLLVEALALRAARLDQAYPADREREVSVAVTALVTALAMNHVFRGRYVP